MVSSVEATTKQQRQWRAQGGVEGSERPTLLEYSPQFIQKRYKMVHEGRFPHLQESGGRGPKHYFGPAPPDPLLLESRIRPERR